MFFIQQLLLLSSFAVASPNKTSEMPINIRVHPLGLVNGAYQSSVDIALGEQITVGPELYYQSNSSEEYTFTATSIGVRGNYFLNGVFNNGIYVASTATVDRISFSHDTGSSKINAVSVRGIAGYGWFMQNLNFMVGAAIRNTAATSKVEDEDIESSHSGEAFGYEASVGWKF